MLFKSGYQTLTSYSTKLPLDSPTYKFYESHNEAMYRIGWYLRYQDLLLTDLTQGHLGTRQQMATTQNHSKR